MYSLARIWQPPSHSGAHGLQWDRGGRRLPEHSVSPITAVAGVLAAWAMQERWRQRGCGGQRLAVVSAVRDRDVRDVLGVVDVRRRYCAR